MNEECMSPNFTENTPMPRLIYLLNIPSELFHGRLKVDYLNLLFLYTGCPKRMRLGFT